MSHASTLRRATAVLAGAVVVAVLAGCAGGGSGSAPVSLLSSGDADTTTGQGLAYTDILKQFTKDTGIKATLTRAPFDNYLATATTKARAGKLNDVVEMLPGANYQSLFGSLDDLTQKDVTDGSALSGWSSTVKKVGGSTYAGVPVGAQGVVWYYNKALFQKAGVAAAPTTWDELLSDCKTFNAAGISPLGMSGADSFILWWAWSSLSPQFFSAEDVNKVRSGDIKLTDKRFEDSLTPLLDSYKAGCWNTDYKGKKFTDIEADFAAGKIAMVPGIISNAMNWQVWDTKLGKDAYGVFGAPKVAGTTLSGQFFNPVLMYGVSKKSKDKAGALKLIDAIASKAGQTEMLKNAGQFPNRTDVDVVGVTGSTGAGAILDLVKKVGGVDVAQNQFNGAAQSAAWTNLTTTMESGDIAGFLQNLEKQQQG